MPWWLLLACDLRGDPREVPLVPVRNLVGHADPACRAIADFTFACEARMTDAEVQAVVARRGLVPADPVPGSPCAAVGPVYTAPAPIPIGRAVTFPSLTLYTGGPATCLTGTWRREANGH